MTETEQTEKPQIQTSSTPTPTIFFNTKDLIDEKQKKPERVFFIADKTKNPKDFMGKWREITTQSIEELDTLIKNIEKRTDVEAWNYGIRTGLNNEAGLDFDWEFLGYGWTHKFGDRAHTESYRTPNGGFRFIYETTERDNSNPFKNTLHTEVLNGGYSALGGYAVDEEGNKNPYVTYSNCTVATDNTIIADTKAWLTEQLSRYDFMQYKCVNSVVDKKHIRLTHEQRLAILNFMLSKDFPDTEIHDFYRGCYDKNGRNYNEHTTDTQIQNGKAFKERGGKTHPCTPKIQDSGKVGTPLYQIFNFDSEQCNGCIRKRSPAFTETTNTDKPIESQADRMYKLFCETTNIDLFHDQNKTEYARIPLDTPANNADNAKNTTLTTNNATGGGGIYSFANKNRGNTQTEIEIPPSPPAPHVRSENTVNSVISVICRETMRLDSEDFKQYLTHLLFDAEGKVANNESKNQVISLLKYDASKGKQIHLYNRVAPDPQGNGFWLDKADILNQAYHITKDGWTLETNVPILFRREEHQQALAEAIHGGDVKLLEPFLNIGAGKDTNITKHRKHLLYVQTASYFIPEIPHPINAMFGVPGSHKSCTQRYIRRIIDPSAALLLRIPRDENAALQVLDHHYIPIFDQIFSMPQWFSDMLCSAVTGAGQESRALFTNDKPFIRSFKRCIMTNGVNLPTTKGDLLNRTILHPTEPTEQRLTEKELDEEYIKVLPSILGGFLDIIVKALNYYGTDEAKPTKKFRMADFTEWGCAISLALGETVAAFITAMEENLASQTSSDIENNNVAEAFLAYLNGDVSFRAYTEDAPYSTTPTDVFQATEAKAEELGTKIKNSKKWPSITSAFTRKLNDSKNAIIACGWNYDIFVDGKNKKRVMSIWSTKTVMHFKRLSPNDSHPCDFCKGVLSDFEQVLDAETKKELNKETLYFCKSCFDSARVRAEADGYRFTVEA